MVADEITLTVPADGGFEGVVHLVLGGLAARLDLTVESLEDLQLALDGLLDRCDDGAELTLRLELAGGHLRAAVGPFANPALDGLEADESPLGLRRVLETVCDSFEVEQRGDGQWVELTKLVERVG